MVSFRNVSSIASASKLAYKFDHGDKLYLLYYDYSHDSAKMYCDNFSVRIVAISAFHAEIHCGDLSSLSVTTVSIMLRQIAVTCHHYQ